MDDDSAPAATSPDLNGLGEPAPDLLDLYLARRAALVRHLTARAGSASVAEDVVQDVYFRLASLSELERREVRNGAAFLYRLAGNLFLDRVKQQQRERTRDGAWRAAHVTTAGSEDVTEAPAADDVVWARRKLAKVVGAVDSLPPACQRAFRLHKLEGLSHAETAAAMGISRSAVEKHISAAVKRLAAEVGWP